MAAINQFQTVPIDVATYLHDPQGWYEATAVNRQLGTRCIPSDLEDTDRWPPEIIDMAIAMCHTPNDA